VRRQPLLETVTAPSRRDSWSGMLGVETRRVYDTVSSSSGTLSGTGSVLIMGDCSLIPDDSSLLTVGNGTGK